VIESLSQCKDSTLGVVYTQINVMICGDKWVLGEEGRDVVLPSSLIKLNQEDEKQGREQSFLRGGG